MISEYTVRIIFNPVGNIKTQSRPKESKSNSVKASIFPHAPINRCYMHHIKDFMTEGSWDNNTTNMFSNSRSGFIIHACTFK